MLLSALPMMTEEKINEIIAYRQEKDFNTLGDLALVIGSETYNAVLPSLTTKMSPFYTITSAGKIMNTQIMRQIKAFIKIDPKSEGKYRTIRWMDIGYGQQ